MAETPSKICPTCGRRFEWRRRWARDWEAVRYCSARCRRGPGDAGDAAERAILELLAQRAGPSSICPSEAARRLAALDSKADDWRASMPRIHDAARRLAQRGEIEITREGQVVDPSELRGAVRLRQPRS